MRLNLGLKYAIAITVVLILVMGVMVHFILQKHEQMFNAQLEMQAKALFRQVVITRRWVAEHGGVFIEKLPWVEPNPYLRNATITDLAGRRYVKENPAMVTKQLSRYAEHEQLYMFHITSLKLMNPENAPDEFETRALRDFDAGKATEASGVEKIGQAWYYRYVAPLYVEQSCLDCHLKQGYKVGDVRGAISVSIPMDYARSMVASERRYMITGMSFIGALLVVTLFLVTRHMVIVPIGRIRSQMTRFSQQGAQPDMSLVRTHDEIEDLSRSFLNMASALQEYHSCLHEKIRSATSKLTEKNESLEKASRSKSDFIAKISHELRTPLTAIKGAMDYLSVKLSMLEAEGSTDLLVFFEMIKKNADRLIRMVNNILDYERIELGAIEMNVAEVNLKDAFQEVVAGFTALAGERRVNIKLKAMDVTAQVDPDRVKQVLTNLVSNALNFSPPSSNIVVSLECRDDTVRASVEDRGRGIAEEDRDLIFRQFYTKDVKEGTGLGLAICRGIVEAHGGEIGVTAADGGGSRFWFTLPKNGAGKEKHEEAPACR